MSGALNGTILKPQFATSRQHIILKSQNVTSKRSLKKAFLYVNMAGFLAEQVEEKTVKISVQASS